METKQQLFEELNKVKGNRQDYLRKFFNYVPETVVRAIKFKFVKKDSIIIREGDLCDTVYIILNGSVAGFDYHKSGKVYYFMDFANMSIIGDFEILSEDEEYRLSIKSTSDCDLLEIPAYIYREWIKHDENALWLRVTNVMSQIIQEKSDNRKVIFMSCKERLMKYLIVFYENKKMDRKEKLRLNKTQEQLSERVGYNIRSVQRSIIELENEELIGIDNGKITITENQFEKMREILEEKESN